ncbi:Mrp/NBP35 family ATP-binding protein [Campylobacter avium]|uniref:Mrp/NBP35 family ATP-binding protein n=1 Tax=Campylobacter avium TaxID=522485 RepID=UPI00255BA113|nr:Mrp/NBP35 family ATP-binding protein [Campylobacter avium]
MYNSQDIKNLLQSVIYPGFKKDIVSFDFVKDIIVSGDTVDIRLEIPSSNPQIAQELKNSIEDKLKDIKNLNIQIQTPKLEANKAGGQGSSRNLLPQVKKFIMVSSGKGGVGKSTTAVNLAISFAKMGKKVGLLDADIYGPNIARMLGELNTKPEVVGTKLKPVLSHGVYIMSMALLIDEAQGLMWRGAMVMKAVEQLLSDVLWPELDILILDMPPGTGDAQITSAQCIPINAGVCVSTPQVVAIDDSKRALDMFTKLHIPIAGIIENMSGFLCPDNGKEYEIFGKGNAALMAKEYKCELLAQIPIELSIREGSDLGKPVSFYVPQSEGSKRYLKACEKILDFLDKQDEVSNAEIQPVTNSKSACSN